MALSLLLSKQRLPVRGLAVSDFTLLDRASPEGQEADLSPPQPKVWTVSYGCRSTTHLFDNPPGKATGRTTIRQTIPTVEATEGEIFLS